MCFGFREVFKQLRVRCCLLVLGMVQSCFASKFSQVATRKHHGEIHRGGRNGRDDECGVNRFPFDHENTLENRPLFFSPSKFPCVDCNVFGVLNGRDQGYFPRKRVLVDTGQSYCLINWPLIYSIDRLIDWGIHSFIDKASIRLIDWLIDFTGNFQAFYKPFFPASHRLHELSSDQVLLPHGHGHRRGLVPRDDSEDHVEARKRGEGEGICQSSLAARNQRRRCSHAFLSTVRHSFLIQILFRLPLFPSKKKHFMFSSGKCLVTRLGYIVLWMVD